MLEKGHFCQSFAELARSVFFWCGRMLILNGMACQVAYRGQGIVGDACLYDRPRRCRHIQLCETRRYSDLGIASGLAK